MYHNRRTIVKAEVKANSGDSNLSPYDESGKLKKGFRYIGNGEITDSHGIKYLIADYK